MGPPLIGAAQAPRTAYARFMPRGGYIPTRFQYALMAFAATQQRVMRILLIRGFRGAAAMPHAASLPRRYA